jgi:hypothetical protein
MRDAMDYYAHTENTAKLIAKLASTEPATLACMHGASWSGKGRDLLEQLATALS